MRERVVRPCSKAGQSPQVPTAAAAAAVSGHNHDHPLPGGLKRKDSEMELLSQLRDDIIDDIDTPDKENLKNMAGRSLRTNTRPTFNGRTELVRLLRVRVHSPSR